MTIADRGGARPPDLSPTAIGQRIGGSLAAQPSSVPAIRHRVRELALLRGAGAELVGRVDLAVTEAVTNVIRHAYGDGLGQVHFTAQVTSADLEVHIADDGQGFTQQPSDGLGLGLGLIAQAADDFEIGERASGGLAVWMRFVLA